MKMISIITLLNLSLLFSASLPAQQKNYYLSAGGNDANDGSSKQTAWRSLEKVNHIDFKPGDSLLMEGGATFNGTIKLTSFDNGSAAMPVVFTSYGENKAIINAEQGDGLLAINTSFLKLSSLSFVGSGVDKNKGSGIHFYANNSINNPSKIEVTNCDAKGFNMHGIVFGVNDKISFKGYRQVRITHCNASENGQSGIASYGSHMGFQHYDFYIAYCKAFRNRGILSKTENHSGNGIVMGMVNGLLIEYCEAFENGSDNRCTAGGPVGIWVWMCKNAAIQYCSSHHNYAGLTKDGGGFDIDGGASNCILQYNYSYNNEGAGYLLAEYGAAFPFTNNIIRFNISVNDGRKNGYGGISVWGAAKEYSVTNTYVYNNTIYVDDKNVVNGKPAAITTLGPHFKNVIIANNIFVTNGNVNFINCDSVINESSLKLFHNNYYSYANQYNFQWGKTKYNSLAKWMNSAPDQEQINGQRKFWNADPLFINKRIIQLAFMKSKVDQFKKIDFTLQPNSLLRGNKLLLAEYVEVLSNTTDYCNNDLPADGLVIPGACIK